MNGEWEKSKAISEHIRFFLYKQNKGNSTFFYSSCIVDMLSTLSQVHGHVCIALLRHLVKTLNKHTSGPSMWVCSFGPCQGPLIRLSVRLSWFVLFAYEFLYKQLFVGPTFGSVVVGRLVGWFDLVVDLAMLANVKLKYWPQGYDRI